MKASYVAVGVLGLAFGGLWFVSGGTKPPQAQAAEQPLKVAAPLTHENLTVYLVRGPETAPNGKLFTLQEGLECGWAVVHETGDVNELLVENLSPDHELFVQSQDLIKGGRQDRLIASDMLLVPGSGRVPVRVHCVEQGRWTGRENAPSNRFTVSTDLAGGNEIKLANAKGNQQEVWAGVQVSQTKTSKNLGRNVADPQYQSSLQMTLENPLVRAKIAEYEAVLRPVGNEYGVIGVAFAVNGQYTGADTYGSNAIFKKMWPKLLRAAAAEAVMEKTDARTENAPSAREVEWYLAHADKEEKHDPNDPNWIPDEVIDIRSEPIVHEGGGRSGEIRGRSGATRQALVRNSGGNHGSQQLEEVVLISEDVGIDSILNPPEPDRVGRVAIEGQTRTGQQVIVNTPPLPSPSLPDPQPAANPGGQQHAEQRQLVEQPGLPMPQPAAQPVNPDGNRLNSNRVENRTALTVESRDAARPGVVIHKSYIKK